MREARVPRQERVGAVSLGKDVKGNKGIGDLMSNSSTTGSHSVREVVAVFHEAGKLENVAEELVNAGFPERRLSLLGDQK